MTKSSSTPLDRKVKKCFNWFAKIRTGTEKLEKKAQNAQKARARGQKARLSARKAAEFRALWPQNRLRSDVHAAACAVLSKKVTQHNYTINEWRWGSGYIFNEVKHVDHILAQV